MCLVQRQLFTSQDVNWWLESCGLLVYYCNVFIQLYKLSLWRHPFTAEDPLVSKWCNAKFLQIWSNLKLVHFQQMLINSLNQCHKLWAGLCVWVKKGKWCLGKTHVCSLNPQQFCGVLIWCKYSEASETAKWLIPWITNELEGTEVVKRVRTYWIKCKRKHFWEFVYLDPHLNWL